jgi:hypothetical protein
VYAVSGSQWSFAMELRDTGEYGFVLPAEQIRPNCEEIWEGMQVMLEKMWWMTANAEMPHITARC